MKKHVLPEMVYQISRLGTLGVFFLAILAYLVTPIAAIRWSKIAFPGVMVEQTLVIASTSGAGWNARKVGLAHPQRIIGVGEYLVSDPYDLNSVLSEMAVGQAVQFKVQSPSNVVWTSPLVVLERFSYLDLMRLFWLPYGVGLVFLILGGWVLIIRGSTGAGRAFSYFSICASIAVVLLFDLWSTHLAPAIWTLAISQIGGAIIGLGLMFPKPIASVERLFWLRFLAYAISFGLLIWGLVELFNKNNPWAYIQPWRYSYIYAAFGIMLFIALMVYRLKIPIEPVSRQQVRIILWGSVMSLAPTGLWFGLQLFKVDFPWNPILFLPFLVIFPITIGIAILRYRLWDVDLIIRRTVVYTILTVILAMIYLGLVLGLERIFREFTGDNQIIIVISTLAIVALFTPLRRFVQNTIDRRFYRQKYNIETTLSNFNETLRGRIDLEQLHCELIHVVEGTMQPEFVWLWMRPIVESQRSVEQNTHENEDRELGLNDDPRSKYG